MFSLFRPMVALVRGTAAYDGIFSNDYEAVTGKVWLNLPLN